MGNESDFTKAFNLLFRSSDNICVGEAEATKVGPKPIKPASVFFSINPLHPSQDTVKLKGGAIKTLYNVPGRRADLNVIRFQNFMFEMDDTPLDSQIEYIRSSGFPFATVTYSGGKSYHAILSLETPLALKPHLPESVDEYKRIWRQLAHVFCARINQPLTILDSSTQNPSRLSRTPEAFRPDKNTTQKLFQLGRLCSAEEFNTLISEAPDIKPIQRIKTTNIRSEDENDMKLLLPLGLLDDLKYPKRWASGKASGNYQNIFRRVLWLIDIANPTREVAFNFLSKYTFPWLVETGYPLERCHKAFEDAYNLKEGT